MESLLPSLRSLSIAAWKFLAAGFTGSSATLDEAVRAGVDFGDQRVHSGGTNHRLPV